MCGFKELLMSKALATYVRSITLVNLKIGKVVVWAIWVLIGLLLHEAFSRYVLNAPHAWSQEIETYVFIFFGFVGGGYVLLRGGHVRMDALYSRWSARRQAITDVITFCFAAVYLGLVIYRGIPYVINSIIANERSPSAALTPLAPVKTFIVIGAMMVFLQLIAFFIKDIYIIRGKTVK